MKRKILIVELWGLGDLTFATPVIAAALAQGDELHLLGKSHAKALLEPSYPEARFITYEAPWTVYKGKYRLWKWNWPELLSLVGKLRAEKFDIAVSGRDDPRDQLLMWLIGAKQRIGFVFEGARKRFDAGRLFLTRRLKRPQAKQHKVDDWHQMGAALDLPAVVNAGPRLDHSRYNTGISARFFASVTKPVICLHTGARIAVRRWPEKYFADIVGRLRKQFDFHLIVIPEPQSAAPDVLSEIADSFIADLGVGEMVDLLGRADLVLCNDSGPGHIAASCGRPVITIFGPSDPDWFRPWGDASKVVIRDICQWRPCFDYCHFSEPHCMTKLLPEIVWPEIEAQIRSLISGGRLSGALLKKATQSEFAGL
ncbi:MAG TPA: glycosyltransferase family 9 protein [Chthoniobacteraceae bacterium]|nr:glycosyltransferase family 9 protein [Chthoniobacteraceae bacterium]